MEKNPRTEIGLLCGDKHVVRQRIQAVHDTFQSVAREARWTTASFLTDEDPPRRIEIPPAALSYFRIIGDSDEHT